LAGRQTAARAVLIDDSPANLKAARAAGLRTVLVTRHRHPNTGAVFRSAPTARHYVDARVRTVRDLPRVLRLLQRAVGK
jgi:FMN phosphatase YigB (HAD superfamily)